MTLPRAGSYGEINKFNIHNKKSLTIEKSYDIVTMLDFFERSEEHEG